MNETQNKLFSKPWMLTALLVFLFLAALGIRLYDLTDLPNDFYMVRQYRSLIIARGMYYQGLTDVSEWQRDVAVAAWKAEDLIEPTIIESITALTYRVVGEHIWVGRVYSSLFWLLGGLAIWLLAKNLSMRAGGLVAVAYFLFVTFGVVSSRTFMPDPLMVAAMAWSIWALQCWATRRTWKSAILAGVLTGFAILVKSVAVFPLLGAAAGLTITRGSFKKIFADKQTWLVAGITILPTIVYYFYGMVIVGTLGSQFGLRFFPALLKDPTFYVRWLFLAANLVGFTALFAALTGSLLFPVRNLRAMMLGLWIGYVVYGVMFAYHFLTHEYYHLPLLLIVAVGLIPVADFLVRQVTEKGRLWRLAFTGLLLLGVGMKIWDARNSMAMESYRHEVAYWQELGDLIGHDTAIVNLSGDYGTRLTYFGWVNATQWMNTGDLAVRLLAGQEQANFADMFAEQTKDKDLFVITSLPEWDNQPELKDYLTSHYTLIAEGDEGYLIFDLHQPLQP